jgi:endonuclease YncB( thermonuclease family)
VADPWPGVDSWWQPAVAGVLVGLLVLGALGVVGVLPPGGADSARPPEAPTDNDTAASLTVSPEKETDGSTDQDGAPENETDEPVERAWSQTWNVTITDIVDGDTVDIAYQNGSTDTVRLLGVDTPEVHVSVTPGEFEGVPDTEAARGCLERVGEQASVYVRDRLDGARVTLHTDPQAARRGGFGRLLGYLVVNGTNLNHDLVARGYGRVYDSSFTQRDRFYAAETDAQSTARRVWTCRSP